MFQKEKMCVDACNGMQLLQHIPSDTRYTAGSRITLFPLESIYNFCRSDLAKYRSSLREKEESDLWTDSKLVY